MSKLITFLLFVTFVNLAFSQKHTLKVIDEEKQALPFTLVKFAYLDGALKGDSSKVQSDMDGIVSVNHPVKTAITVSAPFYQDTTFITDGKHDHTICLHSKAQQLGSVVVTAQYCQKTTENSVHKIQVIDSKQIEKQGAVNLKNVLENQMNIRIQQDNVLGSGITMQGLSGENVKILIDGVPLIGRLDGNIDLSQINLDNIDRIEIIEGPLSVSYGTNALAGTINLITKKTTAKHGNIGINTYYESVGQYNISARASKKFNKFGLSVNAGRNYFDGYSEENNSRNLTWKPKEQYFGNLSLKTTIKKDLYLRFSNDFFYENLTNLGAPRQPDFTTAFDEYYQTLRNNTTVFIKWYLKNNWTFTSTNNYSFYNRKKNNYYKDLTTLQETLTGNENQDTSTFDLLMFRGAITKTKDTSKFDFQLGYDINIESTVGERIEGNTQTIGDYAVYGSGEYKLKRTVIRPGLRYAYNTDYNAPLIPSLNIKHKLSKHTTLRVSYAKGFRAPSLKELYLDFVDLNHNIHGNPDLKAETTDAFQAHYGYKKEHKNKTYSVDLSGFYNHLKNKIDLLQIDDDGNYDYINIGTYKTKGVQGKLGVKNNSWSFGIGATYMGYSNQLVENYNAPSFNYSLESQCNVSKDFPKVGLNVSLFYKYTGYLPNYFLNENDETELGFIDPYSLADLTFSKKFYKNKIAVTTGIKNLFDITNVNSTGSTGAHSNSSNSTSVGWGRSFFIGMKFNIGK